VLRPLITESQVFGTGLSPALADSSLLITAVFFALGLTRTALIVSQLFILLKTALLSPAINK